MRLTGKKLRELNDAIHERDSHCCIVCGRWVEEGIKFHHEPCGIDKSDEIEKGVTLCNSCHFERHNGQNSGTVRKICEKYLMAMYGDEDTVSDEHMAVNE